MEHYRCVWGVMYIKCWSTVHISEECFYCRLLYWMKLLVFIPIRGGGLKQTGALVENGGVMLISTLKPWRS